MSFDLYRGRRDECLRAAKDFTYNKSDRDRIVSRGIGHSASGFTPAFVYFQAFRPNRQLRLSGSPFVDGNAQ